MPRIARYALGRDYHKVLRPKLRALERELIAMFPSVRSRICVDSAPILEREYAQRAGLGWYGKNTCLINSYRGSWFVIGLVLTTAEFVPDEPARGGCGSCTRCVESCPTGCIVFEDGRWQINAERCISYLTIEHRGAFSAEQERLIGPWTFGCDVCQEVCPFNESRAHQPLRAPQAQLADFRQKRSWPSLRRLAVIQEPEWDLLTRGSPVRRTGLEGLRRNARANLDNAAVAPLSSARTPHERG
jgi:epoxyqueuosine reductase